MKVNDSRYIIGIDLGTTNCALSYIDTFSDSKVVQDFPIKQWAGNNDVLEKTTLPSFLYRLKKSEIKRSVAKLSWHDESPTWTVGYGARLMQENGDQTVINSAKSWLCQNSVNRLEKFLPFASKELVGEQALSPVEAQSILLRHLKDAWNAEKSLGGEFALEKQQVAITVPASFDQVAQKLTIDAALEAGFSEDVVLLEEPLSAFYSVLDSGATDLKQGDEILVFDMGGGTTDFSLLCVDADRRVKRQKVSDHILLGGDNIDLLVAKKLESQIEGYSLSASQWSQLKVQARVLKEKALSQSGDEVYHVSIAQAGSSLFTKTISLKIACADIKELILEGFFSKVDIDNELKSKPSGLREFGLSYAHDVRVLAHLRKFLNGDTFNRVLFAGGSVQAEILKEKILSSMTGVTEIRQDDHFLSISRGASRYLLAKREKQNLVEANFARNVFLEVSDENKNKNYMLILEKYSRFGEKREINDLDLVAVSNRRASFRLMTSNEDLAMKVGQTRSSAEGLQVLSPLIATLNTKEKSLKKLKITLSVEIKESGVITLSCINLNDKAEAWPLNFNLNSKEEHSIEKNDSIDEVNDFFSDSCVSMVDSLYGKTKKKSVDLKAGHLVKALEKASAKSRKTWQANALRDLWDRSLKNGITRRSRSLDHELSWLYLAGFCLRPGSGVANDSQRIDEAWKVFQLGLAHPKETKTLIPYFLFWRRLSSGLSRQRQNILFDKFFALTKTKDKQSNELIMLLGSLERLEMKRKLQLGNALVADIASQKKDFVEAKIWSLARLCARVLTYAEMENTIHPEVVESWYHQLEAANLMGKFYDKMTLFYLSAGRCVGNLDLDLRQEIRHEFYEKLLAKSLKKELAEPLMRPSPISERNNFELFDESLPVGLQIL